MSDNFDFIKDTAQDFRPLFERMDRDRDLYYQVPFELRDLETGKPAKDVVNLTLNDPKIFADRTQAFMNGASMQVKVEGEHLLDSETTLIERFDSDGRYEIDESLMTRDVASLHAFLVEQSCIRGLLGARLLCWENKADGTFVPDLLPADSRYLVYEYGRKELEQAAFKTVRSRATILQQYPKANIDVTSKRGGIWEYWNKKQGEIWVTSPDDDRVGGQKVDEKENVFGYVPFIIQGVGAGSMFQDKGSIEHRFESIFASTRLLYDHLNMLGSILQTLNYMTFNNMHLWESEAGTLAKNPPRPGTRKTIPIDKGTRGLFPIQVQDVNNATRIFHALLLGAIQRGSLPNIDYGNLTFPLSAVAISRLTQTKDAIFAPRLQAMAWFYRKLHYMLRDQYVQGGYEAELGEEGLQRTYNAADLDKKYKISFKFDATSPEQELANYASAAQAKAVGMSEHTIFTSVLKLPNPDGEIMKKRAENAEKIDPIIALFRYGHALIDQGNEQAFLESELVADQIENMLRKRYTPAPEQIAEGAKQPPSQPSMLPLLEGGGGAGGMPENEMEMEALSPEQTMRREERRAETVRKQSQEG